MRRSRFFITSAMATASAAMLLSAPATAAEAPAADASVGELIVTATKRNEDVRNVAIAISAVTGEQLQKANAQSLGDYITRLPGVVFNDYQPGVSEVVIRGVAATTYHEQGQTTIGYYLNEVVLVEPGFPIGIPDIDTFDLERVEVLRGPQGTLFGASTLGGLVNYVARTANTGKYDAAVQASVGSTKNSDSEANYGVKAMVNVPIIADKLAVRLTALQRFDAGYLDNTGTGREGVNDFRTRGLRGSAVFEPAAGTKLTYLSAYQDTKLDDQTYLSTGYIRNTPRAEPQSTDFWLNSLRLDQDVGFADFTAIGSVDEKHGKTLYTYPYPYVTGVMTGAEAAYSPGTAHANIKTFEARLASKGDDKLRWLFGVSYMRATKSSIDRIYQAGAAAYIDAHPADFGGYPGSLLAPGDAIYGYLADTHSRDLGLFGEVSYKFTPRWELTLGGRYYDTKNSATITNAKGSLGAGNFSATDHTFGLSQKENGFTPKVTLAFRPNTDTMVYATYSRGFRVGGPNPNAAILTGIPTAYDSDTVDNYEVGVKTSLLDNRLQLDATAFHIKWKDIQARLFSDAPYYYSFITNAGNARINGVEVSAAIRFTPDLNFHSSVTLQDAELTKFLPDTFAVGGGYGKGTTLPGSSKWSVANNLVYTYSASPYAPSFEIAHRYLSKGPVAFGNPSTRGGFNIFDLRATINVNPNVRMMAFLNNAFDEYGVLSGPFTNQFTPAVSIIRPRTVGVKVDWSL